MKPNLQEFIKDEDHDIKKYGKAAAASTPMAPMFRALQADEKRHKKTLQKFSFAKREK
jgi:hypothetical protein